MPLNDSPSLDDVINTTAQREQEANTVDQEPSPNDILQKNIEEEERKMLQDYNYCKPFLTTLIGDWRIEEQRTEANRLTRDIDIDVDQLRELGDIDDDEGMYPVRVIHNNIEREKPPYINFLKNSRRIALFRDVIDETFDADRIEQAFTQGMTYKGWIKPFYKVIDGSCTHGWCAVEMEYDESKPLHAGISYIAHEDLIFPPDSKDIQTASCILRRFKVTPLQLKSWVVKFGFSLEQVNRIIERYKSAQNKDKNITVYKRFCKYDGVVYVSWFSQEGSCTDWLLAPKKLYIGIDKQVEVPDTQMQSIPQFDANGVQVGVTQQSIPTTRMEWQPSDVNNYPIAIHYYLETEKPLIFDHLGRVHYDKDKQEGQTAITTAFVNRLTRSQNVYASPGQDTVNDGKPAKQLASIKWANGTIFDKPMSFWSMTAPEPSTLKALEYLDTANAQEAGQTTFATMNRDDSRKTATEIKAASGQEQLLNSVDLTLFSEFIRDVYSFCWLIVQSQAIQNSIKFLQIPAPQPMQQTMGAGAPPMAMQTSIINIGGNYQQEQQMVNDMDTIQRVFDIRAAGDVDVIQKQELIQSMAQDWPVVQTTSIALRFLSDYLKLKYPESGGIYSKLLEQGDPKNQVIQALSTALQAIVALPDVQQHLTPQMKAGLVQIAQETMAVMNTQAAQQGGQQNKQVTTQQ